MKLVRRRYRLIALWFLMIGMLTYCIACPILIYYGFWGPLGLITQAKGGGDDVPYGGIYISLIVISSLCLITNLIFLIWCNKIKKDNETHVAFGVFNCICFFNIFGLIAGILILCSGGRSIAND